MVLSPALYYKQRSPMRVFIDPAELRCGEITIQGDEHHYVAIARRSRPGYVVQLVDGAGRQASATIAAIRSTSTLVVAGPVEISRETPPIIRVLLPLIKGERMDLCLEKLVELGTTEIIVWPAARSVVKLDGKRRSDRASHYARTVQAAARQCRRATLPTVALAESLSTAIAALPPGWRAVLDPAADRSPLPSTMADVTLVSGPEGGLDPSEVECVSAAGFVPLGLGPRLLRAETAPMVAVALIRAATDS